MKEPKGNVLYEKVGSKYIPVAQHFTTDYWRDGAYLVRIKPGCRTATSEVWRPDYKAILAAAREMEDELVHLLAKADKPQLKAHTLSEKQVAAWKALDEALGGKTTLWYKSRADVARKFMEVLRKKAESHV